MTVYDSPRLAAAYAFDRPRVHERIMDVIVERLRVRPTRGRGLDVGCGAGLSTAALGRIAERTVGLDPIPRMLTHSRSVAPDAGFVVGRAEQLPFSDAVFDIVASAGAINYADRERWLPEAARVLTAAGALIIYDFSVGRRLEDSRELEAWHDAFERRFYSPPGYDLDVRTLPFERSGLRMASYDELAIALPMDLSSYVRYVMSETRIELALSRGEPGEEIRRWCDDSLSPIFAGHVRGVIFDAYVACIMRV